MGAITRGGNMGGHGVREQDMAMAAAIIELSHTPRMPRRHARVARKLAGKVDGPEVDYAGSANWWQNAEYLHEAANHLMCGGISLAHINAVVVMIYDSHYLEG